MKLPYALTTLLICLSFTPIHSKGKFTFNQGNINKEQYYETIPFEWLMDKVIIEAEIDGQLGRYILDTGAMCILFKDSTKQQDYSELKIMKISDANKKVKTTKVVKVPKIKIGELIYSDIPALYIEPFEGALKCFEVDGLIGSNLLRFGAFKIDVEARQLILADSFQDFDLELTDGIKMKLDKTQNSPRISLKMNGQKQKNTLVDTGSGGIYAFSHKVAQKLQRKGKLDEPKYVSSGTNSQGAWGVDGSEKKTNIWQVDKLEIAGNQFKNSLLRSDKSSARIGMQLLANGPFVLDYPQERFFFLSNKEKVEPLSVASFGIDFVSINDTIKVNGIWQNSLAAQSEVQKGDVLVDVLGFELRETSMCKMFSALKTKGKDYDKLEFVFRKRDSAQEYSLVLDRLK
ncbi:aspartyl protease family protein [Carboxylicivirga sp. N1Y90]|uniref:aspartyl protease family protein n=1 Tax=Carboxylicivirga fragile TaxID=3417571 RepID=UPI003D347E40|nr:aspartyl protease family protein [Marinilabiliaceae bacterium N1Y90]